MYRSIIGFRRCARYVHIARARSFAEMDKLTRNLHADNKYPELINVFRSDIMPDFANKASPAICGRLMEAIHRHSHLQLLKCVPGRRDLDSRKQFWLGEHRSVLKVWRLMKQHDICDVENELVIRHVVHSLSGMPFLGDINDDEWANPVYCTREALQLYQRAVDSDKHLRFPAILYDDLLRICEWYGEVERAGAMDRFMRIFGRCIKDHGEYYVRPTLIGQLSKLLVQETDFNSPQVIVAMIIDFVKMTGKQADELALDQISFALTRAGKLSYAEALNSHLESCGSSRVGWARLESELCRGMNPVEIKKRMNDLLPTAGPVPSGTLRNLYETAMKAFMKDDHMPVSIKYEYMNTIYRDMIDRGVSPGIRAFSLFVDLYCRLQSPDSFKIAIFLFNSLLKDHGIQIGTSVNTKRYHMQSVSDIENPVDRWNVMTILNAIETGNLGYTISSSSGYAFANVLIDGISFNNAMALMPAYLEQLSRRNVMSLNMYNSAIEAYARHGQPDEALSYFRDAESKFGKSAITGKTVGSLVHQIKNPEARRRIVKLLIPDYRHVLPKSYIADCK